MAFCKTLMVFSVALIVGVTVGIYVTNEYNIDSLEQFWQIIGSWIGEYEQDIRKGFNENRTQIPVEDPSANTTSILFTD